MPRFFDEPPPQPLPPPVGKVDRRALLEAYQEVVRTTKERPSVKRLVGPARRPFSMAIGLAIVGLTALLALQPRWMFNRPQPETPQLQEASLRVRMFVEIDRLDRFKQQKGRWPTSLFEAGGDTVGLNFERRGPGYIMTGSNGPISLRYTYGSSPEAFLGNSYQLIRGRGK